MTEWLLLLAAVVLTALTGFFVAAEFSLTTVDRGRAEEAARAGDAGAGGVVTALRSLSTQPVSQPLSVWTRYAVCVPSESSQESRGAVSPSPSGSV